MNPPNKLENITAAIKMANFLKKVTLKYIYTDQLYPNQHIVIQALCHYVDTNVNEESQIIEDWFKDNCLTHEWNIEENCYLLSEMVEPEETGPITIQQAFDEGQWAKENGLSIDQNPHEGNKEIPQNLAWRLGWFNFKETNIKVEMALLAFGKLKEEISVGTNEDKEPLDIEIALTSGQDMAMRGHYLNENPYDVRKPQEQPLHYAWLSTYLTYQMNKIELNIIVNDDE